MRINKDIFREYDIRGIADHDFAGEFPFILGKAFGYYLNIHNFSGKLAVSGDVRPSTKRLKKEFINGALSVGINVIDLGILPDNWTVVTKDHSLSAQWEHTILVTRNGYEVLTIRPDEKI